MTIYFNYFSFSSIRQFLKSFLSVTAFAMLSIVFVPFFALASSGAEHHSPWYVVLLWPCINFLLFSGGMYYLYRKHGASLIRTRSVEVEKRIEKAGSTLREAQGERDRLRARLMGIDTEKTALLEHYEAEAGRMSETIVQAAHVRANAIAQDTVRQVENEIAQARKELRVEAISNASQVARELLGSELTPEVDRHLRSTALDEALF